MCKGVAEMAKDDASITDRNFDALPGRIESDRASLLKALAKRLGADKFSYPSRKNYRPIYLAYPELSNPIAAYLSERFEKGYTASSLLPEGLWNYGNEPLWNLEWRTIS